MITISRYHDFCAGHRVVGHESKCKNLHGHNYRITITAICNELDAVGRVIDFSVIKEKLFVWLEINWDHRMLIWYDDPWRHNLQLIDYNVLSVTFNPTAENMAIYLLHTICPPLFCDTGCKIVSVELQETRKCSATATL